MREFKKDCRIARPKLNGVPGWVDVKAGETPEAYGLDPADCAGYLTDTVDVPDGLKLALDIAYCISQMIEADPEQKDTDIWTSDKKPKVRVIEGVIKQNITEAMRDEAWKTYIDEVNKNDNG